MLNNLQLIVIPLLQFGNQESSLLADRVKLNWQYEEAKKK